MKQLYTTLYGNHVWLEGYPTVEPKPGYQQRYLMTFTDGNIVTFNEFEDAYRFLKNCGCKPEKDYVFGVEVEELGGMQRLIKTFKENRDMFGWQRKSDYQDAYERYEAFHNLCQLWDIAHEEYGVDSEFWLCERYLL